MPEPTNKKLYEEVKKEIYAKHPKHSAYRSGLLVQEYKKRGGLTAETNQRGLWGAGLKRIGKIRGVKQVIKRKGTFIDQPNVWTARPQQHLKN